MKASPQAPNVPESFFVFRGGDLLLPPSAWPQDRLPGIPEAGVRARLRFPWNGAVCHALRLEGDGSQALPEELETWRSLAFRSALGELSESQARGALKAQALLNWREVSRHCGACGTALIDDPAEGYSVGARRCPDCGRVFYPRLSPAVIVLVEKEGKILLAHNASFPAGRYSLIAGFVEPGESLEETVRRELLEEVSIEVKDLRYADSQPWPFPDSLMLAFRATWSSGDLVPDGLEITDAHWYGPDELPNVPPQGSVARRLIDAFLARGGDSA